MGATLCCQFSRGVGHQSAEEGPLRDELLDSVRNGETYLGSVPHRCDVEPSRSADQKGPNEASILRLHGEAAHTARQGRRRPSQHGTAYSLGPWRSSSPGHVGS